MSKADELIRRILSDPDSTDDGGILINDLLDEVRRAGHPVESLRPLLLSPNGKVVKAGVFIASELGKRAAPLFAEVIRFLAYPDSAVRSDAIGYVLSCATGHDQAAVAAVISMLDDPDRFIRWRVMRFLTLASPQLLQGAMEYYERTGPLGPHALLLRWLISDQGRDVEDIASKIRSDDSLCRRFAVAAATRIAEAPLVLASTVDDKDVGEFAEKMIKMLYALRPQKHESSEEKKGSS